MANIHLYLNLRKHIFDLIMEVDEMFITAIKEKGIRININYKRGLVGRTIQNNLLEKNRVKIAYNITFIPC